MLQSLWRYRSFVLGMAGREFQARYLGSALGSVWSVLNPLATIFIYTVIFGRLMRSRLEGLDDGLAYGIFLCAGVLTWNMFTEILQRTVTVFVEQANLLKKMSFPRSTLPAIVLASANLNFAVVAAVLMLILWVLGRFPGWTLLGFLPLILLQQALAIGLGLTLGVLNVFFRDVAHAVTILLQFWFWFTPIVYPMTVLGDPARSLIALNPMSAIAVGYQDILVHGRLPGFWQYLPQVGLAVAGLWLARVAFRRLAPEMVDEL